MRLILTVALAMMTLVLAAADISGTWKGAIDAPMGALETTITIQAGPEIGGTVKTEFFESKIENGKLEGEKISFEIDTEFGRLPWEGTIAGDEMKLQVTSPDGNKIPVNCKRQK